MNISEREVGLWSEEQHKEIQQLTYYSYRDSADSIFYRRGILMVVNKRLPTFVTTYSDHHYLSISLAERVFPFAFPEDE